MFIMKVFEFPQKLLLMSEHFPSGKGKKTLKHFRISRVFDSLSFLLVDTFIHMQYIIFIQRILVLEPRRVTHILFSVEFLEYFIFRIH